jgi:hypothetical protein
LEAAAPAAPLQMGVRTRCKQAAAATRRSTGAVVGVPPTKPVKLLINSKGWSVFRKIRHFSGAEARISIPSLQRADNFQLTV